MQQAARVSDRTAFFYLGELVEYDDTKKMFTNPKDSRTHLASAGPAEIVLQFRGVQALGDFPWSAGGRHFATVFIGGLRRSHDVDPHHVRVLTPALTGPRRAGSAEGNARRGQGPPSAVGILFHL